MALRLLGWFERPFNLPSTHVDLPGTRPLNPNFQWDRHPQDGLRSRIQVGSPGRTHTERPQSPS